MARALEGRRVQGVGKRPKLEGRVSADVEFLRRIRLLNSIGKLAKARAVIAKRCCFGIFFNGQDCVIGIAVLGQVCRNDRPRTPLEFPAIQH